MPELLVEATRRKLTGEDFLVRLVNDLTLLLEIKGYEVHNAEQTNSKHNAARRWVRAVNNLGEFGKWDFLVCRDLDRLLTSLAAFAGAKDYTPPESAGMTKEAGTYSVDRGGGSIPRSAP